MNVGANFRPLAIPTSLLRYAPGLVALAIVIADSGQTTDTDLWGHIRFGQAVVAQHRILLKDIYTYTMYGKTWSNHEWLTEVVMAAAYNGLGVIGLKLWKFACVAATMLLVVMGLAETRATPTAQLNTLTVVAVTMMPQMEFRPQLFSFLLFAAVLALLARHNYRRHAPLWLAVPIMMLWGNLHGVYIIGIATFAIYTSVIGLQDLLAGRGLARALRLGLITLAGTLATLVSPYGIDNWLMVINALKLHAAHPMIVDWQPLLFAMMRQWQAQPAGIIYMLCAVALMVVFIATVALEPRGGDLPLVVIAAVMCVAAFAAVRNLPLAIIACALPVARHSSLLMTRVRERAAAVTGAKLDAPAERSATSPWLAGGIAIVLAAYIGIFSPRLRMDKPYPSGAVAFLRAHDLHGNILDEFGWGEYLIWHTAPASKVFIDGRYDLVFPYPLIDRYVSFYFDRPGAQALLTAYPHDLVLIPSTAHAYNLMRRQTGWKLIYRDSDSALFARADSATSKISGAPVAGNAPAVGYFP